MEEGYCVHIIIIFFAASSHILKAMSGKMCSSNSVVQAQKLVDQLRVEASMERIKVRKDLNHLLIHANTT